MKRSILINPNGILEVLDLDPADELAQLQTAVAGYVEAAYPTGDTTLWFNEDGRMRELPINGLASQLWWKLQPGHNTQLRGVVVVTGGADRNGDSLPVTAETESLIRELQ